MRLLYSTGIAIYYLAVRLAGLFSAKARSWHYGRRSLFDKLEEVFAAHYAAEDPAPVVWFHCASLGEFEQGKPVIEAFRKQHPSASILLTFFSPSGYNHRLQNDFVDHVFYLPIDTIRNARRFVRITRPAMAVFVKYEFWFNYLNELFKHNIPVFTISAIFRPDQHFFKWYGGWARTHLRKIKLIFVQDEESAELLRMVEINNSIVGGDTRFDRVAEIRQHQAVFPLIEEFISGCRVVVAGSTWPPDELLLHELSRHTDEKVKFIVAPHEISETHLKELAARLGSSAICYSQAGDTKISSKRFLIIDSIGMLSQLYCYATITYVGGGFGVGIHNTLEAATWSKPVFFGPNYHRFREAREMVAEGAAFSINDARSFVLLATRLLNDPAQLSEVSARAGNYVTERTGATQRVMEAITMQGSNNRTKPGIRILL